jgi:hypothetical protein
LRRVKATTNGVLGEETNRAIRIRYEETGSGFPLLVTPGVGLNSRVSNWPIAVFNVVEVFRNDFRCITMDPAQRERQ